MARHQKKGRGSGTDIQRTRYPAIFYRTEVDNVPILKWLNSLSEKDRKIVELEIAYQEINWPETFPNRRANSMPGCRGMWEINRGSKLSGGRLFRLFFFEHRGNLVLTDYIEGKQSVRTPLRIKERAMRRMESHRKRHP